MLKPEDIPRRIKTIRKYKHLTLREAGARMGLDSAAWRHYEAYRKRGISIDTLFRICDVLGITIEEFVFWPERPWLTTPDTPPDPSDEPTAPAVQTGIFEDTDFQLESYDPNAPRGQYRKTRIRENNDDIQ